MIKKPDLTRPVLRFYKYNVRCSFLQIYASKTFGLDTKYRPGLDEKSFCSIQQTNVTQSFLHVYRSSMGSIRP